MSDRMVQSIVSVLKEAGVEDEPIGIDIYDPSAAAAFQRAGVKTASAWPTMSSARVVKTPDEIECLKISSAYWTTSADERGDETAVPSPTRWPLLMKKS